MVSWVVVSWFVDFVVLLIEKWLNDGGVVVSHRSLA